MKLSFLFGAGAEIAYGLPSGGKFALDIFRQDSSEAKQIFKENRGLIDNTTIYSGNWLPCDYDTKNVSSYGKAVYESIIKDTVEHNREKIIKKINDFDKTAEYEYEKSKDWGFDIKEYIEGCINRTLEGCNMSNHLSFSDYISKGNDIFKSNWFSALLLLYKNRKELTLEVVRALNKVLMSILQLQLGALSEDFTKRFNENLFKKKDDQIDFLDDISDIIRLNYQSAGLVGLDYIMEKNVTQANSVESAFLLFLNNILENIYSYVLDYKSLIDSNWHYLYCPKDEWTKFCKISIFLITVQKYIKKMFEKNYDPTTKGYYNDVFEAKKKYEILSIATTNYNTLINKVINEDICYLNGSTETYYDPYLNRIGSYEELQKAEKHFIVPLLFTQSGTKPMTSIDMSQKYVDVYNKFKQSDIIFVVGFGFNADDEHINGIVRTLIDIDDKKIIVVDIDPNLNSKSIAEKLKVNRTKNIEILTVDKNRMVNGKLWIESFC